MTDREKWVEALARLTWKTQEGEIKWRSIPAIEIDPAVTMGVEKAFETTFRKQRIRAYRTDEMLLPWGLRGRSRDRFVIEFLDDRGTPVYRPPLLDGTKDLFSAIEYQAAPVGDFIDALLRD
jgi:hypothetical protein